MKNPTFEGSVNRIVEPAGFDMFQVFDAVEVEKVKVGPETPFIVVVAELPAPPQVVVAICPAVFTT